MGFGVGSETRREPIHGGSSPAPLRAPGDSGNFPQPGGATLPVMVSDPTPKPILRHLCHSVTFKKTHGV